ncbi:hypothetical protein KAJ02_03640 [Candidatus Bipolaricaulota bacterium]|nr:hypothetical protein [Candidatus Bipolaricaulota bacterium]
MKFVPLKFPLQQLMTGVIVRLCSGYDLPECLRVSIGTTEQNQRLAMELERLFRVE